MRHFSWSLVRCAYSPVPLYVIFNSPSLYILYSVIIVLENLPVVSTWLLQTVVAIHDITMSLVVVAASFVMVATTAELVSAAVVVTVVLWPAVDTVVGLGLVAIVVISAENEIFYHYICSYSWLWYSTTSVSNNYICSCNMKD